MKKIAFQPVVQNINLPQLEDQLVRFWKENKTFEKSVESRPPNKHWTFLDGPPFITGLPHYGTLLSSIPKDLYPRYWTMKGFRVRRVWGWDCHGLPAENKVENKLGIKRKKDIEDKIGVKRFIDECKAYVSEVSGEWEWYIDHIARWVDFKNAYKTMDLPYMETVMWVFKQLYEKKLIYKGLRVSLYCPHCSTPISNFEVAMDPDNYKEITEPTDTYKYKIINQPDTYLLAWSTTPWNKLVTPALAVNPKLVYVKVKQGTEFLILAKSTLKMLTEDPYQIIEEFKGETMLGWKFEPHYDFYKIEKDKKAFVVIGDEFVTAEEGTGIVTIAAYGEEDLAVMKRDNIQIVMHVDDEGKLLPSVPKWAGMFYLDVNPLVNEDLKSRGLLYREIPHTHTVPTCWRCHTRLYYAPQDAWYVDVQSMKKMLAKTNKSVNWFPKHFKEGRFLKSLEAAPDWCISRSRYWGSPVPVWECKCGTRYVPSSIAELEKKSGRKIADLHKPEIDEVTVKCESCGEDVTRVPEVLDSWTEAGSAPYAERHYPFNTDEKLEDFFPPDFIVEYTGQIRAWFYVLHVLAGGLFETAAFKNVSVTGVILGTDGRKMSKNYGNYPDPKGLLEKYGGDALRLYLLGSPVMHGEDIIISEEEYRNQVRGFLLILWNVYNFFVSYAAIDLWQPSENKFSPTNVLDQWILSKMYATISDVSDALEKFDSPTAIAAAKSFVTEELSTWYVRRIRDRVGPSVSSGKDKDDAYQTLWTVLTEYCKTLAPITPFITEEIYRNLTGEESVHLTDWPSFSKASQGQVKLLEDMKVVRKICEMGHAARKTLGIKVRQPLQKVIVQNSKVKISQDLEEIVKEELNVKSVEIAIGDGELEVTLDSTLTAELEEEGKARDLIREIQGARKEAQTSLQEKVVVHLPSWPKSWEEEIKKQTLADKLVIGETLRVEKV